MATQTAFSPQRETNKAPGPLRVLTGNTAFNSVAPKKPALFHTGEAKAAPSVQHLVNCGSRWRDERETAAGWELVQQLRSADLDTRLLAAEQLAQAEHSRLRRRDLRRARGRFKVATKREQSSVQSSQTMLSMKTPYGLGIIENCTACNVRMEHWFCGLSESALNLLGAASHLTTFPGDAVLFVEGQMPKGTYVLCSGKVKLSTTSKEGKVLILKHAVPGDVLGLSAVLTGHPFGLTAETIGPCRLNFIESEALIHGIEQCGELGLRTSIALSREFQSAQRDIHDLVLARSSAGKLARLLLSWARMREDCGSGEIRLRSTATHEQMAQMIGSSRETVTRLLGDLRKKDLIRLEGSTLVIRNIHALQGLAA